MTVKTAIHNCIQSITNKKNEFTIGLFARLLMLCCIAIGLTIVALKTHYIITSLLLLLLLIGTFISIMFYVHKPQEKIAGFVGSLLSGSDIPSLSSHDDKADEVALTLKRITDTLNKIKIDKQAEYELFTEIINRMDSAVLVIDDGESVKMSNKKAKQLLHLPSLVSITQIDKQNNDIATALRNTHSGKHVLIKTTINELPVKLMLSANNIQIAGQIRRIITLNNIQEEVAKEEVEAWQKIIRIMAHEIINSSSPINILAYNMLSIVNKGNITHDDLKNLSTGLEAIANRSKGMITFMDNYRTKTIMITPAITTVRVGQLFSHIITLFKNEINDTISIETEYTTDLTVQADERLLEQVLINLVRNSIEAADKPQTTITLQAKPADGYILIHITDNGCGISPQTMDNLFTPFFTTKEKGMGIGLFVSRNMIWSMQGQLTAQSVKGKRTVFSIRLPA